MKRALLVVVVGACWQVGCGSQPTVSSPTPVSSSTVATTPTATVTSINVTGSAPAVGVAAQYTATATLSNGTTQNVTGQATWQSSNTVVATVSSVGLVTAGGLGVADLRATYQSVTGLTQVTVTTVAPGRFAISTSANAGWTSIDVSVNGQSAGTLKQFLEPEIATSCDAVPGTRVVAVVPAGAVTYTARSDKGATWTGSQQVAPNGCFEVRLTCTNRNCGPAPAPAPAPTPSPIPSPAPISSLSSGFYVWGGSSYSQYLGVFTCLFCQEFATDSINNQFGTYGSKFSSTSIRNQFGTYGSEFSSSSSCNQFASNPPRVYNANHTVYYGELTLNQFRVDAIKTSTIVGWLRGDVCSH